MNELKVMTMIECHLKSGKVITYWQKCKNKENEKVIEALETMKDYPEEGFKLTHINNPYNTASFMEIPVYEVEFFLNTGISVIPIPAGSEIRNGVLKNWSYTPENG